MPIETIVMSILGFALVMTIVVSLHEMGHYLAARYFGIVPSAFAVGFGPELTGYTDSRGTRWKINALPVGGYVRFPGPMHPAQVTRESGEQPEMAMLPRSKRAVIVGAGPAINLVLTLVLFTAIGMSGKMALKSQEIDTLDAASPLIEAGLQPGDRILSIDGKPNDGVITYMLLAQMSRNQTQEFVIQRGSETLTLDVTSARQVNPATRYGLTMVSRPAPRDPYSALVNGLKLSRDMLLIQIKAVRDLVTTKDSLQNINGPATTAKMSGEQLETGFLAMVVLVALLSNAIGFINLLPLPGLDGGHLAIYAVEGLRGADIGPRAYATIQTLGVMTIAGMIILGLINDISILK